jgi:prepilin-type N-terminal cleavage/methylation domain-containing protein
VLATRPAHHLHRRTRRGFTLVEIMAVVIIIVILAGVATFAVTNALGQANENATKAKMQSVVNACKMYYSQKGEWPGNLEMLIQSIDNRPPMLEGGPSAISDTRGQEFGYQVTQDQYGSPRVVLTAQTQEGNTIQWPER